MPASTYPDSMARPQVSLGQHSRYNWNSWVAAAPDKTRIVYCKDGRRAGSAEHTAFDFLGYTFRTRGMRNRHGQVFTGFGPAISKTALSAMSKVAWCWRLHRHTCLSDGTWLDHRSVPSDVDERRRECCSPRASAGRRSALPVRAPVAGEHYVLIWKPHEYAAVVGRVAGHAEYRDAAVAEQVKIAGKRVPVKTAGGL